MFEVKTVARALLGLCAALTLTACGPDNEADSSTTIVLRSAADAQDGAGKPVSLGTVTESLMVLRPWVRLNPLPDRPAAAYFTVINASDMQDRLIGVDVPGGGQAHLHRTQNNGEFMQMLMITSVTVPAGGTVAFEPGGFHVMLFDLPALDVGGHLALILHLQHAGDIEIAAEIRPITDQGPGSAP